MDLTPHVKCSCGEDLNVSVYLYEGKEDSLTDYCPTCKEEYKVTGQLRGSGDLKFKLKLTKVGQVVRP